LTELEQTGVRVLVVQGDVSREEDVRRVLREAAATQPPLRGVIHAAGVVDDGVLTQQSWSRFRRVFAAKVDGAWNLHRLTAELPLDFMVFYSSTAALLGSPGQGNHSAANAFLDSLAAYRRSRGLPALSINWGAWGQIGAAAGRAVQEWVGARGMGVIEPGQGLRALEQVWSQDVGAIGVVRVDWTQFLSKTTAGQTPAFLAELAGEVRQQQTARQVPPVSDDLISRLRQPPPAEVPELLAEYLQRQTARVLGLDPNRLPERGTGFTDLGMDSLMAVELRNRLQADLGTCVKLPSTLIFDYPNIDALTGYLSSELNLTEPFEESTQQRGERVSAEDGLEQLSDQELGMLLDEKLADILSNRDEVR
jgi:NAD(P)-dependent dehydrogenase (short-subunit alcohol dehydrogenase family)